MRVLFAGLRVALMNDALINGLKIDEDALRNSGLVGLKKSNGMRIGRPPIGDIASTENLLPINPGKRAIKNCVRRIGGEASLLFRGNFVNVDVIGTHKGNGASVGRELGVLFLGRGIGDPREGGRGEIEKEDVAAKDGQGPLSVCVKSIRP